jgi:glycosyltransferase involved in cell wall biosynthesis
MSCGIPVVASDLLSFLVRHGQEGYLIPTGGGDEARVAKMRDHLATLLADEERRLRMGRDARASAVAGYAWPSVAERVEAVYRRAAK